LILSALRYLPTELLHQPEDADDVENTVPDLISPGEISLTDGLKEGFKDLLSKSGVELKFTYGDWSGLSEEMGKGGAYGLVLTSETIYEGDSLGSLTGLLRNASKGDNAEREDSNKGHVKVEVGLEESLESLNVKDEWRRKPLQGSESVVLVGAKVCFSLHHHQDFR